MDTWEVIVAVKPKSVLVVTYTTYLPGTARQVDKYILWIELQDTVPTMLLPT